jgi:hypothetical protein
VLCALSAKKWARCFSQDAHGSPRVAKFHILQHASQAVDEVGRAEFFRQAGAARDLYEGSAGRF